MKTILLTFLGALLFSSALAQREIDLKVALLSPQDGAEIAPMQSFPINVLLVNQSTEPLLATDSLAVYMIMNGDTIPQMNGNFWIYDGIALGSGEEHTIQKMMAFDNSVLGAHIDLCIFVRPYSVTDPIADPGLTDNMGCAGIDVMEPVINATGEIVGTVVKAYPNPVRETLYFEGDITGVTITDLSGKPVLSVSNASSINCSALPGGIYLANIFTTQGSAVRRIVVQK